MAREAIIMNFNIGTMVQVDTGEVPTVTADFAKKAVSCWLMLSSISMDASPEKVAEMVVGMYGPDFEQAAEHLRAGNIHIELVEMEVDVENVTMTLAGKHEWVEQDVIDERRAQVGLVTSDEEGEKSGGAKTAPLDEVSEEELARVFVPGEKVIFLAGPLGTCAAPNGKTLDETVDKGDIGEYVRKNEEADGWHWIRVKIPSEQEMVLYVVAHISQFTEYERGTDVA